MVFWALDAQTRQGQWRCRRCEDLALVDPVPEQYSVEQRFAQPLSPDVAAQ